MLTSVVIAVHNGEKYLRAQLHSILNQTITPDELIVVFDKCNDTSEQIVSEFINFLEIRMYFVNYGNHAKTFSFGISKASNKIVFLCDQDDLWTTDKLEKITTCFKEDSSVGLVVHNAALVDENLNTIQPDFFSVDIMRKGLSMNVLRSFGKLKYYGCMMAINTDILRAFLPIPNIIRTHDRWLGYSAQLIKKVRFIDENLILYRRHQGAVSNFGGHDQAVLHKSSRQLIQKVKDALVLWFLIYFRRYLK